MRVGCRGAIWIGVVLWLASCATGTPGEARRADFEYRTQEVLVPVADDAMAMGSEMEIEVGPYEEGEGGSGASGNGSFQLKTAKSGNPEVLEVVGVEADAEPALVRIKAKKAGRARLHVETSAGADRRMFRVAQVGRVDLSYWLESSGSPSVDEKRAALLRGGSARFRVTKYDSRDQRLIGGGVEQFVEVEPSGRASIEVDDPSTGSFDLKASGSGTLTLRGRPSEEATKLGVVGVDDVAALNLFIPTPVAGAHGGKKRAVGPRPRLVASHTADVNGRWPARHALPARRAAVLLVDATTEDGRRVFGLGGKLTANSKTSRICGASVPDEGGRWVGDGLVLVEAKQPGVCRVQASLGETTATYQFVVVESSS